MFAMHLQAAMAAAHNFLQVDNIVKAAAKAFGAGGLNELEAESVFALAHARRQQIRSPQDFSQKILADGISKIHLPIPRGKSGGLPSYFPPKRRVLKERTAARWQRKNRLGMSSPLPFYLERDFTIGQLAVVRIVADDVFSKGRCTCTMLELADRAGVSLSWAKQAIRIAKTLGLLAIEERPQWRAKHKSNIITIISEDWLTWIKRAPRRKALWAHQMTASEDAQHRAAARALLNRAGQGASILASTDCESGGGVVQIQKSSFEQAGSSIGIGGSFVTSTEKQVIYSASFKPSTIFKSGCPLPFAARRPINGPGDGLFEAITPQRGRTL